MGAVADFVGDVVDTVGDVVETVGDVAGDVVEAAGKAVETVGDTVGNVVEGALQDPIGTMASVAAIATQQYYLLPAISAGKVVANGGDLDDALKAAAITYAAGEIGGMAGDQVSTAANYGTELGSSQTAMLAAQDAGMGMGTLGGKLAGTVAGAGTGAALSGRDLDQSIMGALAGFGMNLGMNTLGQVINEAGDVIADSYDEFLASQNQTADQPGDYPLNAEELAAADLELGGLPSINQGDQPGDYPLNAQELAAEDAMLKDWTNETPVYGDQPGDFPTTPEELAAADNELAAMPSAGGTADQPGDYDTTAEEVEASEKALSEIPDSQNSSLNTKGVQDYFANQFKNSFLNNLLGGGSGTMALAGGLSSLGASGSGSTTTGNTISPIFGGGGDLSAELPDPMQAFRTSGTSEQNPTQQTQTNTMAPQELEFDPVTGILKPKATDPYAGLDSISPVLHAATGGTTTQTTTSALLNPVFSDTVFPKQVAKIPVRNPLEAFKYADGGQIEGHNPEFYSEGGASLSNRYVKGDGDGTSDSVPAMLATGEFVIPADVVSSLGNGDNDSGAVILDEFLRTIREHKRAADSRQLPPDSKGPLAYLTQAQKKVRK